MGLPLLNELPLITNRYSPVSGSVAKKSELRLLLLTDWLFGLYKVHDAAKFCDTERLSKVNRCPCVPLKLYNCASSLGKRLSVTIVSKLRVGKLLNSSNRKL